MLLVVWALASFGICFFARDIESGQNGAAWAYGLAGQGLLMVFIALVVVNAAVFNRHAPDDHGPPSTDGAGPGV